MPNSFIQSAGVMTDATSTTQAVQFTTQNVANGNLIVVAVSGYSSGAGAYTVTVADGTNNYIPIAAATDSLSSQLQIFYAYNIANGGTKPTVTATYSTTCQFRGLIVHEYSGPGTTDPLDKHAEERQDFAAGTDNMNVGPVTPTTDGQIIFASANAYQNATTTAPGTNFFERQDVAAALSQQSEDLIQTSAAAISATWTDTGNQNYLMAMATFKEAPSSSGPMFRGS